MTAHIHLDIAEPIAAYFEADRQGSDALAQCFTRDAVVKDEGQTYTGLAAIQRWKAAASARYQYRCEPLRTAQADGKTVVTCRLTGTFPGSPIELRYFFQLERGKIASLEILP